MHFIAVFCDPHAPTLTREPVEVGVVRQLEHVVGAVVARVEEHEALRARVARDELRVHHVAAVPRDAHVVQAVVVVHVDLTNDMRLHEKGNKDLKHKNTKHLKATNARGHSNDV